MKTGDLIGSIYESIGDPEALAHTVGNLAAFTGSISAQFGFLDRTGRWLEAAVVGVDPYGLQLYLKYHHNGDPRAHFALRHPGRFHNCSQMVDDVATFEHSALVEHLNKFDGRFMVGAYFPISPSHFGGLGFFRPRKRGQYDSLEVQRANRLLPHLQRAMSLHVQIGRLQSMLKSMEGLVDRLRSPVLLVDADGRLRFANSAGQEALHQANYLVLRNGRIEPRTLSQVQQFTDALALALSEQIDAEAGRSSSICIHDVGGHPAVLSIYSLRGQPGLIAMPQAAAVVFLTYPNTDAQADANHVQRAFRLTPAEARLVEHLLHGESLTGIAERLKLSRETLKSQLHSLFAKTGTARQAELIALLLALVSITTG